MPPDTTFPPAPAPSAPGFVVAMRARIALGGPSIAEWLIVARWGAQGEYLSLGRTFRDARRGAAPINLAPVWTVVGRLLRLPPAGHASFLLTAAPPAEAVAGAFAPAEGHVRLSGRPGALRLFAEGMHADAGHLERAWPTGWRLRGEQRAWIGEFMEDRQA